MLQGGEGLGLVLEPRQLRRPGEAAVEHHLHRDRAVEPQVTGPVDDAHAAPADDVAHAVAGDLRPRGRACRGLTGSSSSGNNASSSSRTEESCRRHARTSPSRSGRSLQTSSAERPDSAAFSRSSSTSGLIGIAKFPALRSGPWPDQLASSGSAGLQVLQLGRQQQQRPLQPALDGLERDAEQLRRLDVGHAVDPHQVQHLAFAVGEALDGVEHATGRRRQARSAAGRGGQVDLLEVDKAGLII